MSNYESKSLVPKLRFPEFKGTGAWKEKPLKEVFSIFQGFAFSSKDSVKDGVRWLKIADISIQRMKHSVPSYLPVEHKNEHEKYLVKQGDYVIALTRPILGKQLKLAPVDKVFHGALLNQRVGKLVTTQNIGFVYNLLQTSKMISDIEKSIAGSEPPNLSTQQIENIKTYIPLCSEEQEKVANCLFSIDDLITAHVKKLESIKNHKKGLIQQLFPADGETAPKLRFPEFSGNWDYCSIQDLIDSEILLPPKDGNHGNIHPKSSDFVKNGIPFIMASDLSDGEVDLIDCSKISKNQADALQKGFSKTGDVLLTHKGTVGEVAVVPDIKYPFIMLTPQVTYYRVIKDEALSNKYLASVFQSPLFQSNLSVVSGGGTRAYVGITEQRKLKIWIPENIAEQRKIAEIISSLDDSIKTQAQKVESLKVHKKGLVQKLFPSFNEEGYHD